MRLLGLFVLWVFLSGFYLAAVYGAVAVFDRVSVLVSSLT